MRNEAPTFVPNMADTDPEAYLRIATERAWVGDSLDFTPREDFEAKLNSDWFTGRTTLVGQYAWAIPNREAIEKLVALSPVVEIGAGGGYWAWLVNHNGGKVFAYDIKPHADGLNSYMDFSWGGVEKGGPEKVLEHRNATLFLCWPDYGGHAAYDAARLYQGDKIVYIGEGVGGCTGDQRFFKLCMGEEDYWFSEEDKAEKRMLDSIEQKWHVEEVIDIPQYYGLHDRMYIMERIN